MFNFILVDNNGYIAQSGTCPFESDLVLQQEANPDLTLMEVDAVAGKNYIKDGVVKEYPPLPQIGFDFDYVTEQWFDARPDSMLLEEIRKERDKLLAACDWTQVSDAPVDQEAWRVYRQALRDFPETVIDLRDPVWPTKPV